MRHTVILVATIFLTATAASAAPRSLSTGEPTVELPPQRVQVLEAPQVQLTPAPAATADTSRTTPAQTAPTPAPAAETPPAPVATTPPPAETPPAVVEAPPVQASPAIVYKPAKQPAKQQAAQRRQQQPRHASTEQRIRRELRGYEHLIGVGIGAAVGYGIASVPYYW